MSGLLPPLDLGLAVAALDQVAGGFLLDLLRNALYATALYALLSLALRGARIALRRVRGRRGGTSPTGLSALPPAAELLLWALVLVRLVLPADLAAPWSLRAGLGLLAEPGQGAEAAPSALLDLGAVLGAVVDPAVDSAVDSAIGGGATAVGEMPWALLLLGLWLAAAGVAILRFVRRRRQVRCRLVRARRVDDLDSATDRWRALLGIRRSVTVVVGEGAGSPFTVGILRPVIWLPARLVPDPGSPLAEAAVAHELHHVRGLDDLWLRLVAVVRALYFFLPVAWWASARLAECRERAIDDAVLAHRVVSPRAYGRALLAAGALTWPTRAEGGAPERDAELPVPAFGTDRRSLPMRIERIVRPTSERPTRRATLVATALTLLLAAVALPMAALPSSGAGTAAVAAPSGPVASAAAAGGETDEWTSPLAEARVTSPFGPRKNPLDSQRRVKHHDGVDLAAPMGTPILAPAAGTVTIATETYRPNTDWGTVLVIDHGNGIQTRYAHLGTLEVREGQTVARGERVATVGTTGRTTGPHLHLEVLEDGEPTDPARLVPGLDG